MASTAHSLIMSTCAGLFPYQLHQAPSPTPAVPKPRLAGKAGIHRKARSAGSARMPDGGRPTKHTGGLSQIRPHKRTAISTPVTPRRSYLERGSRRRTKAATTTRRPPQDGSRPRTSPQGASFIQPRQCDAESPRSTTTTSASATPWYRRFG